MEEITVLSIQCLYSHFYFIHRKTEYYLESICLIKAIYNCILFDPSSNKEFNINTLYLLSEFEEFAQSAQIDLFKVNYPDTNKIKEVMIDDRLIIPITIFDWET